MNGHGETLTAIPALAGPCTQWTSYCLDVLCAVRPAANQRCRAAHLGRDTGTARLPHETRLWCFAYSTWVRRVPEPAGPVGPQLAPPVIFPRSSSLAFHQSGQASALADELVTMSGWHSQVAMCGIPPRVGVKQAPGSADERTCLLSPKLKWLTSSVLLSPLATGLGGIHSADQVPQPITSSVSPVDRQ